MFATIRKVGFAEMQEKQRIQFSGKVVSILKEQFMRREIAGRHGWNGIHK